MDEVLIVVLSRHPLPLLHNNRGGPFHDITPLAEVVDLPLQSWRGVAFGDINNDGKVDVLILNVGEPPTLLLNCAQSSNHAATFKLVGTKSNKAAIGARVTITAGALVQLDEVRGGGSYLSQNDLRLHPGLGNNMAIGTVEVSWPSGSKQNFKDLPADFIYTIEEGSGIQNKQP